MNPIIILAIIAIMESSGNPNAYNPQSKAKGLYQITPICLADYNAYHLNSKISYDALSDTKLSEKVASWYLHQRIPSMLRHYNYPVTDDNILIAYNCGISCLKRKVLPTETINYLTKYQKLKRAYEELK